MLIYAGCTTISESPDNYQKQFANEGSWKSRIHIDDKKNSKTFVLMGSFRAVRAKEMRLDLTLPGGYYVGSVLLEGDDFKALVALKRRVYIGKSDQQALKKAFGVNIDPRWFRNILFDEGLQGWNCDSNPNGSLKSCVEEKENISLNWKWRPNSKKTVEITSKGFVVEMSFNEFTPEVKNKEKAFNLRTPKSFKTYHLQ